MLYTTIKYFTNYSSNSVSNQGIVFIAEFGKKAFIDMRSLDFIIFRRDEFMNALHLVLRNEGWKYIHFISNFECK